MNEKEPNSEVPSAQYEQINRLLREENSLLREQLKNSHEAISDLSKQLRLVQEQMVLFRRNAYGTSSEKIQNIIKNSLQPELFDFSDETDNSESAKFTLSNPKIKLYSKPKAKLLKI